jgi:hypothetical protein
VNPPNRFSPLPVDPDEASDASDSDFQSDSDIDGMPSPSDDSGIEDITNEEVCTDSFRNVYY